MSPALWRDMVKPLLNRTPTLPSDTACTRRSIPAARSGRLSGPDRNRRGRAEPRPMQLSRHNPLELKKEFGQDLAFMGGVDTQGVLPNGTTDQVAPG